MNAHNTSREMQRLKDRRSSRLLGTNFTVRAQNWPVTKILRR